MAGEFVRAAQLGGVAGFAVDTDSAREMILSIGQVQDQLKIRLAQIHRLKVRAKLGGLPEALAISELDSQVASGDTQSLQEVLQRFAEVLEEADQALEIGMRNYEQIETQAEQDFGRISHP